MQVLPSSPCSLVGEADTELGGDCTCKGPRWEENQSILGEMSGKERRAPWRVSRWWKGH